MDGINSRNANNHKYFVNLLYQASTSTDFVSLAEHRSTIVAAQSKQLSPFGKCQPQFENGPENTTMAEAAHSEWTAIENLLRRILTASRRSSDGSGAAPITEQ